MPETAYQTPRPMGRLEHHYGPRVHILSDPWGLSLVARAGHPATQTPDLLRLVDAAYRHLLLGMSERFPLQQGPLPTRMTASEPRALYSGQRLATDHRIVLIDVARAGTLPAHGMQAALYDLWEPEAVRVDHLYLNRAVDPVTQRVTGTHFHGSKIGGAFEDATLIVPDPMDATGGTIVKVLDHYRREVPGRPKQVMTAHLIVTPEFLRRVLDADPNVHIYALRMDRGLSSEEVLQCPPGLRWSEEVGLDRHDYIIPGAGGLGEWMNNAFV